MTARTARQRWVVISLLACFVLLAIWIGGRPIANEPIYQGKAVSVWFREYAYNSNPPSSDTIKGIGRDGTTVVVFPAGYGFGRSGSSMGSITNLKSVVRFEYQYATPDPAIVALKALGTNAIPHLVKHLRVGLFDSTYLRVFTNLPGSFQQSLPNPIQKMTLQLRAMDFLGKLGIQADTAVPALLKLLRCSDPVLRGATIRALKRIHPSRQEITKVLLEFGSKGRYTEVIQIAQQLGWEGDDMARMLAGLLRSPSIAMRRDAVTLLEKSGAGAKPAVGELTAALTDPDNEVRYLAARALQGIGVLPQQTIESLRSSLQDTNVLVQSAARRALQLNGVP